MPAALAFLLLASAATSVSPAVSDDDRAGDRLPLRRITLYRSGVGYFEHAGTVQGDQSFELRFDADKVNDILKSMTILDLGSGQVGPVRYGSKEPLERRLSSFGVDISGAPDTVSLFRQLRGAELECTTTDGATRTGTVLGVEQRDVVRPAGEAAAATRLPHLNLLTPEGVRSLPLPDLLHWRLTDAKLAGELRLALAALAEQRAERIKSVHLDFFAPEEHDRAVMVSYVHEMPVWKTSYRLVLPDDEGDAPKLQGWAIVENTTDEAWSGVRLSLASGRPSSFTMDLYEPIFTDRPDVPVPTEAGLVARNYESERPTPSRKSRGAGPGGPATPGAPTGGARRSLMDFDDKKNKDSLEFAGGDLAGSQATGQQAGGQFLYTVDTPVQLERQRSAMLPILLADVEGRRVSIYDPAEGRAHPLRGVELRNDTRLHLMPGPIAVFDGGTYAGDAQIPHTARNQTRLLAYALDLDVGASSESTGRQTLVGIKIVDGLVEQRTRHRQTRSYQFVNHDGAEGRSLLIEHHRLPGWDLIEPSEPHETTDGLYRFELALDAGREASLEVTEELVQSHRYQLSQLDLDTLLVYRRDGKASDAVVAAVSKAAGLQREAREFQEEVQALDQERQRIAEEQQRIRENLARIQTGSELARRYVGKLGEQEDRLEQILEQRAALLDAKTEAERALAAFLRDLDVE